MIVGKEVRNAEKFFHLREYYEVDDLACDHVPVLIEKSSRSDGDIVIRLDQIRPPETGKAEEDPMRPGDIVQPGT